MAAWTRGRIGVTYLAGLIHHSDAGSQYVSLALIERLTALGMRASIGTVADAYDNALAESTIGLYKTELIRRQGPWRNVEHVELATLANVERFNSHRLHSELHHVPPAEFETAHYARPRAVTNDPTPTPT